MVRLVVLSPAQSLSNRASEPDDAGPAALEMLRQRGDAPRVNRQHAALSGRPQGRDARAPRRNPHLDGVELH